LPGVDASDGKLGVTDAARASERRGLHGEGLCFLQGVVERVDIVGATDEVEVPRKPHEERNLARHGTLLYLRQASEKLSRAS